MMKSPFPHSASAAFFCGLAFLAHEPAGAEDFVAVSSKVSHGYVRTVLADGTVEPESYVFKEGGYLSGRIADPTIDRMTFADVSKTLAGPLSLRKYTAAVDPKEAKLLIVVYWGTTRAPAETSSATTVGQQEEREVPPSQLHPAGLDTNLGANLNTMLHSQRTPLTYNLNFGFEYEFAHQIVLSAGYVGSRDSFSRSAPSISISSL